MDVVNKWTYSQDGHEFYTDDLYDTKEEAAEALFAHEDMKEDWGFVGKIVEKGNVLDIIDEYCIDGILSHLEDQVENDSVIHIENAQLGENNQSDNLIEEVRQAFLKYLVNNKHPIRLYDIDNIVTVEMEDDGKANGNGKIIFDPTDPIRVGGFTKSNIEIMPEKAESEDKTKPESIIIPPEYQSSRSIIWG